MVVSAPILTLAKYMSKGGEQESKVGAGSKRAEHGRSMLRRICKVAARVGKRRPLRYDFAAMQIVLSEIEARVLGCLIEKEITTPEYYPLSLNALVNACNQKSNRDPHMNVSETDVHRALRQLNELGLARSASTDSRVAKYEHRLAETYNFTRPETAIFCELLLRGAQTPGELRSRAERMHPFEDLSLVHTTLRHLTEREPPLVALLARQPGTKEARYAQLLSVNSASDAQDATGGLRRDAPAASAAGDATPSNFAAENDRVRQLEHKLEHLQQEVVDLQRQFAEFRKQFE
jgi:uncharacterized protein